MQIRNLTAGLAIMGAGVITPISAPAFAQGAESYASEIAAFESMRSSSPSGALASETSVMALLSNIPAPFEVSVGSFFSEGGGDVAENVEITFSLEDEFTIGFRIEELRAYGLSDSQISALAANETAEQDESPQTEKSSSGELPTTTAEKVAWCRQHDAQ